MKKIVNCKIIILGIVLIFSACTAHAPKVMSDKARLYYNTGVEHLNEGNPNDAIGSLREAERLAPKSPEIKQVIGLAYFSIGVLNKAEQYLLNAQKLDPENPRISNNLSGLYLKLGRNQQAIEEATKAINNIDYRTPAAAHYNRGMAFYNLNQPNKAETEFKQAISIECLFDKPYLALGRLYIDRGQYDSAIEILNSAVRSNKNNPYAYLDRGIAKWHRGYITEAENDFIFVLRLVPDTSNVAKTALKWLDKIQ